MDMLGADELDAVLACLQNREACAAAPAVCRAWRTAAAHCSGLLPPLRPAPGLELAWLQQHAGRLAKLTLRRVADLGGVQRLSRLQALRLESCPLLEDLSPLAALPALRSLALSSCRSVGNLGVVAHLTGLTRLALDRCLTRDLGVLCGHPSLSELAIAYDVWVAVGLVFPTQLPALTRMRIMAEIQVRRAVAARTAGARTHAQQGSTHARAQRIACLPCHQRCLSAHRTACPCLHLRLSLHARTWSRCAASRAWRAWRCMLSASSTCSRSAG